jgi:hypothetical protein
MSEEGGKEVSAIYDKFRKHLIGGESMSDLQVALENARHELVCVNNLAVTDGTGIEPWKVNVTDVIRLLDVAIELQKQAADERDTLMRRHWERVEVIRNRVDNGGLSQEEKRLLDDLGFSTDYDRRRPEEVKS